MATKTQRDFFPEMCGIFSSLSTYSPDETRQFASFLVDLLTPEVFRRHIFDILLKNMHLIEASQIDRIKAWLSANPSQPPEPKEKEMKEPPSKKPPPVNYMSLLPDDLRFDINHYLKLEDRLECEKVSREMAQNETKGHRNRFLRECQAFRFVVKCHQEKTTRMCCVEGQRC